MKLQLLSLENITMCSEIARIQLMRPKNPQKRNTKKRELNIKALLISISSGSWSFLFLKTTSITFTM